MKLSLILGVVLGFVVGLGSWARANCKNGVDLKLTIVTKNGVDEPLPTERTAFAKNDTISTYDYLYDPTTGTFVVMEHRL